MLRTYVLSSDGAVSSTVTILPATTEVTDQIVADPVRTPSSEGNVLDGLDQDGYNYVAGLQIGLIVTGCVVGLFLIIWVISCVKHGASASPFAIVGVRKNPMGVRQESQITEGTPLFSRFKHEI
jgi:hypothetical protein